MRTRNRFTSVVALAAAMIMVSANLAMADEFTNDVPLDLETNVRTATIASGGSVVVKYWIDDSGSNGCDADPAPTVTVNAPTGVTATPSTLSFTQPECRDGVQKSVTFSSSTPSDGYGITHTLSYTLKGGSARTMSNEASFSLVVTGSLAPQDTTPPAISYVLSPEAPDGANGWYKSDVSLTWTVTEDESTDSLETTGCVDQSITADQDATSYSCSAISGGGAAGPVTVSIKRDATAPTINAGGPTALPTGLNGWYTTAVTNRFVASDALSGLAGPSQTDVSTGTSEGNAVTVSSGPVADLAGNSNPGLGSAAFKIDLTDPTDVAFVGGPASGSSHYFGSVPAAPTCTADDAVSGLASCDVTGHSTAVGTHTLTATATDNAGRTATATRTYSVLAWNIGGLYKPVDMEGVWNTAKGGSTIPLKFEVFAGATELKETSAISGLAAKRIACPGGAPEVSEVEVLASGSTTLRFDSTGDQFIYNWKTPTGAGCYELKVSTADGSSVTALFNLRK